MKQRKKLDISLKAENKIKNSRLTTYLMDSLPFPVVIVDQDRIIIYANSEAKKMEVIPGTHCWDTFGKQLSITEKDKKRFEQSSYLPVKGIKCTFCMADECLQKQTEIKKTVTIKGIPYEIYWKAIEKDMFLHYAIDITNNYE